MRPQLTICVPTYNRAEDLDRQLSFLHDELSQHPTTAVELIVSDNCSTDHTADVVNMWRARFPAAAFIDQRHPTNIGWMRNFLSCYERATGRLTWIIGDDDVVLPGALGHVLATIDGDPELALLYLNFAGRDAASGRMIGMEHWFDPELADWDPDDGLRIFQHSIERHFGAVIFTTATIVRTDLALAGINCWRGCLDNWGGMAFWCAHAALHGRVRITRQNWVECTLGQSYWDKDPDAWFRIRHHDIPEVYAQMRDIGYERAFCARKVLKIAQEDVASAQAPRNVRDAARAFVRRPLVTCAVIGSYVAALFHVVVNL